MGDPGGVAEAAALLLERVRSTRPLVHHLTNVVTAHDVASVTLALGALPVLAHASEEVEEVTSGAGALVLNLGTLTRQRVEAMRAAGRRANERGIPVVLDPVGVGLTRLRTQAARILLEELRVTVVRGNLAEMAHLSGAGGSLRGVESLGAEASPEEVAQAVARRYGLVAAVTGPRDWVAEGRRLVAVDNGHPLLTRITGAGCMASAVVGCFLAVAQDPLVATAAALAYFGLAAELAAQASQGPGSFRIALLDQLEWLRPGDLHTGIRAEEMRRPGVAGG